MKLIAVTALAAIGASVFVASATAQQPPNAVMLVPGVWTTPEISAKCQAFAAKRVGMSQNTDNSRQAVALACAQKLWKQELAKAKRAGSKAGS